MFLLPVLFARIHDVMRKKNTTPTVLKLPWYGFDHKKVAESFEGGLSFVNEFCIKGEYKPVAVYRAANPNITKGHKKYMLLQTDPNGGTGGLVRGMSEEEMEKERYQSAVLCLNCNHVIYSMNRHDFHPCICKKDPVMVDGGKDYLKVAFSEGSRHISGTLDLLTDSFTTENKK